MRGIRIGLLTAVTVASACDRGTDAVVRIDEIEEWTAEASIIFGHESDSTYSFGPVGSLTVGPDGKIYTAHPQERTILRWTVDGKPAGEIGGPGSGPGEFERLGEIGFHGDTLWALDSRAPRVTLFDTTGTVLGTTPLTIRRVSRADDPTAGNPWPSHRLADGTFHARQSGALPQIAGRDSTLIYHLRTDASGSVLDTLLVQVHRPHHTLAAQTSAGDWLMASQPYADGLLTAVEPASGLLVAVDRPAHRGEGEGTYRVTGISERGDTVFHRSIAYTPEPLPERLVDQAVAGAVRTWSARTGEDTGPTEATLEDLARDAVYAPDHHPPVTNVVAGEDGTVWLRGSRVVDGEWTWTVLGSEGDPLARLRFPYNFMIHWATRDAVVGVQYNRIGVPFVVRYEIRPSIPSTQ